MGSAQRLPTYYDRNRDAVLARYDALDPAEVHAGCAPAHLPSDPGFACDIGAGSGRDSNWLAARGWEVVAVEPSALRDRAARDSHQRVVWMNDALPDLRTLRALGRRFHLILLSAVWMHVAPKGRERAFRILSELLDPSGLLVITLRLGGDAAENAARGFHDTSAEELIGYANRRAIALRSRTTQPDLRRPGLKWETLVFAMPDDGTGSLPLLRHVIVNDNKSSTYKLGLLRTLVRLAETAPGLIIERTDDLRGHSIRGRRPVLVETVLAPGVAPPPAAAPIGAGRLWLGEGSVPPTAGRLAFRPSARRPVRCGSGRHPHPRHQRRLRQYREDAGALHHSSGFRVAAHDAVAARDGVAEGGPATDDAFEWTESRYDTSVALERAKQLRDGGFALTCVWSASRIRSSPHIDHCFPWARWRNNDLSRSVSVA